MKKKKFSVKRHKNYVLLTQKVGWMVFWRWQYHGQFTAFPRYSAKAAVGGYSGGWTKPEMLKAVAEEEKTRFPAL